MSIKGHSRDRVRSQPLILNRKRKAEKEIMVSNSPEFPSPSSSTSSSNYDTTPSTDTDISGDEAPCNQRLAPSALNEFRGLAKLMNPFSNTCRRASPLPDLAWAEQKELWHSMVLKDAIYARNHKVLKRHPDLEPRMRAILIDWLSEVSEVFKIHRETFHLAIDYIDRFLMAKSNLPRNYLQLLGITALFVASKMEEIYPPKLEQFSYVTDGACSDADILTQELVLIMTLNWNLSPITMNCWVNIFMQLAYLENGENLLFPEKYPTKLFVHIHQVLDMCTLDIESLRFPYSIICASAIAHFISKETAMHVSGLGWNELVECVVWMKPFVEVVVENLTDVKTFQGVEAEDAHNIHTHTSSLKLLDSVQQRKRLFRHETSPSLILREMTPPQSSKKPHLMVIDE